MYGVLRIIGEFDELLTILRSKRSTRIEKKNGRGRVVLVVVVVVPYRTTTITSSQ